MICFLPEGTNSGSARSIAISLNALNDSKIINGDNIKIYYHAIPFTEAKIGPNFKKYLSIGTLLPYVRIYKGANLRYWVWIRELINLIAFAVFWFFSLRSSISKTDLVYINSISLFPILWFLPRENPVIIHIREQFNTTGRPILSRVAINLIRKRANQIIAIDTITKIPFDNLANCQLIRNGFSMENARIIRKQSDNLRAELGIPNANVVSMIGTISYAKGSHRFLELCLFMSNYPEWHFVAVGCKYDIVGQQMLLYTRTHSNLTLLDETKNIDKIYAISDFIIRCEDYLPLGRTVWEGLYAGCKVLVPTRPNDKLDEINSYLARGIWLYPAENVPAMANILLNTISIPFPNNIPCSNIAEHTKKMSSILHSLQGSTESRKYSA